MSDAPAKLGVVAFLDVRRGMGWAEFRDAVTALPGETVDAAALAAVRAALAPFEDVDRDDRDRVATALAAYRWVVGSVPISPAVRAVPVRRAGWTYVVSPDATGVEAVVLAALAAVADGGVRPAGRRTWERSGTDGGGRLRWRLELVEPAYGQRVAATVLEANVDDMPAEVWSYVQERLFAIGARDVWFTPIGMKKSRPAVMVSVLTDPATADTAAAVLFEETTTLGIRRWTVETDMLDRRVDQVATLYGTIPVKVGLLGGRARFPHPEYEVVADAARRFQVPFRTVYEAAVSAWQQHFAPDPAERGDAP